MPRGRPQGHTAAGMALTVRVPPTGLAAYKYIYIYIHASTYPYMSCMCKATAPIYGACLHMQATAQVTAPRVPPSPYPGPFPRQAYMYVSPTSPYHGRL